MNVGDNADWGRTIGLTRAAVGRYKLEEGVGAGGSGEVVQ